MHTQKKIIFSIKITYINLYIDIYYNKHMCSNRIMFPDVSLYSDEYLYNDIELDLIIL
jgi:hypothetical protein